MIFQTPQDDPDMLLAYSKAHLTFGYFLRELYWEKRRIVPGLSMSMAKLAFTDGPRTDGKSEYEHMWIRDVGFDGEFVTGILMNAPGHLECVTQGEFIGMPFAYLSDWMMVSNENTYGGYTVQAIRAQMTPAARAAHDQAWGLNFGDPQNIQYEIQSKTSSKPMLVNGKLVRGHAPAADPLMYREHPMCLNMLPQYQTYYQTNPAEVNAVNEDGWTPLHVEAMAGNLELVKLLLAHGAQVNATTPKGDTAEELAGKVLWVEIGYYLHIHDS